MLLFTPGPTPVPENIRVCMSEPTIHHRTPEFEEIFAKARAGLKKLLNMPEVLMLSSSGTGSMEACLTNLCTNALTVNSGKFGERFGKICKAFNIPYTELVYPWDTPASLEDITRAIKENPNIDSLCIQICESAGGLRHPVERIAAIAKELRPNIMIIADGITAVGVEEIDTTNIDALITGSQKAFMLPPGLSMIGLSNNAVTKLQENSKGFYFNLAYELKNQIKNTTAYTAATTIIIGLAKMLENIEKIGYEIFYFNTKARSQASDKALQAIGLKIYPQVPALSMSSVYHKEAKEIRSLLKKKYNVNIAGGQDHLADTLLRINHMGIIPSYETVWVLNSIELALDDLGIRIYDGTANKIFSEYVYKGERL